MEDWGDRDPAWAGIRSVTLDVLGRPVSLLRHDPTGDGPPQLLIHGLGSSSQSWLEVIAPLSRFGEVVAVDLPGFGHTPVPPGGSARCRANAHFVPAVLDALGWQEATLFGRSMGALIATLAAGWHQERVGRLVLVNPALPPQRADSWRVPKRVFARIIPASIPGLGRLLVEAGLRVKPAEQLLEDSLVGTFADPNSVRPALRRVLVDNLEATKNHSWRREALYEASTSLVGLLIDAREINEAIAAITAPTLVVWGDRDLLVSAYVIDGLIARRSDWTRHVFTGIGHAPTLECPEKFVKVVADWYAGEQRPGEVVTTA
jgi:pimeloyl-ACP methyl ester carboxylesterase